MGRAGGDVDADNNDGSEDMQVRVYCACLPDSLFIYCFDRRLFLEKQIQNTLHLQNDDSQCREPKPKATWCPAIAARRAHQACFGAAEPNSQQKSLERLRRLQPNAPAP